MTIGSLVDHGDRGLGLVREPQVVGHVELIGGQAADDRQEDPCEENADPWVASHPPFTPPVLRA